MRPAKPSQGDGGRDPRANAVVGLDLDGDLDGDLDADGDQGTGGEAVKAVNSAGTADLMPWGAPHLEVVTASPPRRVDVKPAARKS